MTSHVRSALWTLVRDLAYHVIGLKTPCLWVTLTAIPNLHFVHSRRCVCVGVGGGQNWVTFGPLVVECPHHRQAKKLVYFFLYGRQYDLYVFSSCFFVIFACACDVKLSKSYLVFLVNFSPFPIQPVSACILLGNLNTRQLTVKSGQTYSPM